MTNTTPESSGKEPSGPAPKPVDAAGQGEQSREGTAGRGARKPRADETSQRATGTRDDEEFLHAMDEIAARLRRRGVQLTGRETGEELTEVLEAVERFEAAVQRGGGDLMVDEPVSGGRPVSPDNEAFVLPQRQESESIPDFIERVARATSRAREEGDEAR